MGDDSVLARTYKQVSKDNASNKYNVRLTFDIASFTILELMIESLFDGRGIAASDRESLDYAISG